ncbi:hypothetical protein [Novosphingobium lentum]|uniref:hypothetical protein n=1 Tax=Novosphingobium lentum TaxID=145287 RepID=UPI000833EC18|nr:hypothetical protein [Novosphingobium lentum]
MARSWRRLLRDRLAPYPRLFLPAYRRFGPRQNRHCALAPDTELVIEGFARSANTWSVVAFRSAQPQPVRLAHHLHVEAQVIGAVRRGLPVVVLIRDPAEALRSLKFVLPAIDENHELRRWLAFYRVVETLADRVVIATSEQATADFGAVVARVNARFGTAFAPFCTNPDNVERVFAAIAGDQDLLGTQLYAGRPSTARTSAKQSVPFSLAPAALAEAQALHARLTQLAIPPATPA